MHRPSVLIALLALPVTALLASAVLPRATAPAAQQNLVRAKGQIGAWRVTADGTIFVRIDTQPAAPPLPDDPDHDEEATELEEAEEKQVWFRTPPEQTAKVSFELLLIEVLLENDGDERTPPTVLTMIGDEEVNDDADSWDEAHEIVAVTRP